MSTVFVPTPANVWKVTYVMSFAGKHSTMTHYVSYTPGVGETMDDFADHYADSFASQWAGNFLSRHWSYLAIEVQDASVQDGQIFTTQAHSFSSVSTEQGLPPEVALVISERSAFPGRSRRGRMFMPGLGAVHYDDALPGWNTTFLTGVQTDLDAWRADAQSSVPLHVAASQWQIASKISAGAPRALAVMTDVTSCHANTQPCSQRRRQTQHHGRLR